MLLNSENLSGVFKGFRLLFTQFLNGKATFWEKVATKVISATSSETYAWLLNIPQMREWIGDREIKNLAADDYTICNKEFESTVSIPRAAIEDDTIGVFRPAIGMMAEAAKSYPDKLVAGLMKNGIKNFCYDKLPFFSDAHKVGKNIAGNRGKKKLTPESYGAARAAMMSLQNAAGESLGITPNLLVVPPALEGMALKILKAQQIEGTDNIYFGSAELLVLPELAGDDTAWYLFDVSKPVKPFVVQERRPVEFVAKDKPDDESAFMKNVYLYGTSWRGNAGYTLWQLAYRSDGTAGLPHCDAALMNCRVRTARITSCASAQTRGTFLLAETCPKDKSGFPDTPGRAAKNRRVVHRRKHFAAVREIGRSILTSQPIRQPCGLAAKSAMNTPPPHLTGDVPLLGAHAPDTQP